MAQIRVEVFFNHNQTQNYFYPDIVSAEKAALQKLSLKGVTKIYLWEQKETLIDSRTRR